MNWLFRKLFRGELEKLKAREKAIDKLAHDILSNNERLTKQLEDLHIMRMKVIGALRHCNCCSNMEVVAEILRNDDDIMFGVSK